MNRLAGFMARLLLVVAWLSSPLLVASLVAFLVTGNARPTLAVSVLFLASWIAVSITYGRTGKS